MTSSAACHKAAQKLEKVEEWNLLPGLKPRWIESIHVTEDDNHTFVCDWGNQSLIELNELGEVVTEFLFCDEKNRTLFPFFFPVDMCSVSPGLLVVCGVVRGCPEKGKFVFFERLRRPPFLKVKEIIETESTFFSLCEWNGSIFVCDLKFKIHSFTNKGKKLHTIEIGGLTTTDLGCFYPRIRVDPLSGNFWGSTGISSSSSSSPAEIVSFNSEGEKLSTMEKGEDFFDFCLNKFGHFYFSTKEGIFTFLPDKKLCFKFDEQSEFLPRIFVSENKISVCVKNGGKHLIKIFQMLY